MNLDDYDGADWYQRAVEIPEPEPADPELAELLARHEALKEAP